MSENSRSFEVLYKVVVTWDLLDNPKDSNFLQSLTKEDAHKIADDMIDCGVARFEFMEVREA